MEDNKVLYPKLTDLSDLLNNISYFPDSLKNVLANMEKAASMPGPRSMKVFDWEKAEMLIRENNVLHAGAYLEGDEDFTSDTIWINGKPNMESWFYPCSIWATPMLVINGWVTPCYVEISNDPDAIDSDDSAPDPALIWPMYQKARLPERI